MSETIHGDSAEAVAYALFELIRLTEAYKQSPSNPGAWLPGKEWILSTYAECVFAVKNSRVQSR
jgi:hypothetical protein